MKEDEEMYLLGGRYGRGRGDLPGGKNPMPLTRQLLLFSTTDTKPLNVNDVNLCVNIV